MDARELIRDARQGTLAVVHVPDLSGQTFQKPEDVLGVPALGAHGSAVAIRDDRFITCFHVIEPLVKTRGSLQLVAALKLGPAEIVYQVEKAVGDQNTDVALLSASQRAGKVVPLVLDPEDPEMGSEVLCLGVPFPEKEGSFNGQKIDVKIKLPLRAVKGIVASGVHDDGTFEVDVQLNPGMSGGPVLSLENGRVTGICQGFRCAKSADLTFPLSLSRVIASSTISRRLGELEGRLTGRAT